MYNGAPHTRELINCHTSYIPTSVLPKLPSMLYLYRNPEIKEELSDIFSRIEKEYENKDIYNAEALKALSYELFFLLARNIEKKEGVEVGSIFVEKTVSYIQKNYMEDISLSEQREPSLAELSRILGESERSIGEAMEAVAQPVSLYDSVYSDTGDDSTYIIDKLTENLNPSEELVESITLKEALKKLNDKEMNIINRRFFKGKTQMEIADEIGISQAQVSRLEKQAIDKLRKYMQ